MAGEKLLSEFSVDTVFAGWSLVNSESFHVVNSETQVGRRDAGLDCRGIVSRAVSNSSVF